MSRTERFAILAAVIGLLVDVIALAKFSGFLPAEEAQMNRTGASVFYVIIALILICYSLVIFGVFSLRKIVVKWRLMGIVPSREAQHVFKASCRIMNN